jgi:hypothetical protein
MFPQVYNRKFVIGIISVTVLLLILIGFAVFLFFFQKTEQEKLGCLIMLPEKYCSTGKSISYMGEDAIGFKLPAGVEIRSPFNGAYFQTVPKGYPENSPPIEIMLGIPDTSSFVAMVGLHSPIMKSGMSIKEGEVIAYTVDSTEPIDSNSKSTLVIYTTGYDINSLFRR